MKLKHFDVLVIYNTSFTQSSGCQIQISIQTIVVAISLLLLMSLTSHS
jgi:hypothetical protein